MDGGLLLYYLVGCFALGMLHGVIPDEHTWPITFAYSIGTTTGKGGMRAGAYFSTAFTLQRAIMSQVVYFAFSFALFFVSSNTLDGPVYFVVGLAMAIAGYLILAGKLPHIHPLMRLSTRDLERHTHPHAPGGEREADGAVPAHWAMIHGFISGFGVDTGLFTVFVYFTAIPFLAQAGLWEIGWLPGALFGLGTFLILMLVGFFFGGTLQIAQKFGTYRIAQFGRMVGARVLLFGGIVFMIFGPLYYYGAGAYLSQVLGWDPGTFLVVLVMAGIAFPVMLYTWREVQKLPREHPSEHHLLHGHHDHGGTDHEEDEAERRPREPVPAAAPEGAVASPAKDPTPAP